MSEPVRGEWVSPRATRTRTAPAHPPRSDAPVSPRQSGSDRVGECEGSEKGSVQLEAVDSPYLLLVGDTTPQRERGKEGEGERERERGKEGEGERERERGREGGGERERERGKKG